MTTKLDTALPRGVNSGRADRLATILRIGRAPLAVGGQRSRCIYR